ncbi:MAG: 16S rRNA (cytosine(967)-C(5))-methyltransferase RsmB [Myxococcota bacterium]
MNPATPTRRGRPSASRPEPPRRSGPTRARLVALRVLERVERGGAYGDRALHAELGRSRLSHRDRALVTELVQGTLRFRGRLDYLLAQATQRNLRTLQARVVTLLRLGAYQIVFTGAIPARAAVDESVRCARAVGLERATGLVNAALRRLVDEHASISFPDLGRDPEGHLVHALSLPPWIAERWLELFGPEEAAALAGASNVVPPVCVRANRMRVDREALLSELRPRHPQAMIGRLASDAIVLGRRGAPGRDPGFLAGRFTIQDEASQLVVEVLAPRPGERILDVCAAPGTKATALAERVGKAGEVLALDKSRSRLDQVARDARRLGLPHLRVRQADASQPLRLGAHFFDRVLVDAPCSGLGTLRRHPDLRWRVRPEDPKRLSAIQQRILERAAAWLRPGGTLVYSTCTVLPEENEGVVEAFLAQQRDFRLVPADELPEGLRPLARGPGYVHTLPHRHDVDGFFIARLERLP